MSRALAMASLFLLACGGEPFTMAAAALEAAPDGSAEAQDAAGAVWDTSPPDAPAGDERPALAPHRDGAPADVDAGAEHDASPSLEDAPGSADAAADAPAPPDAAAPDVAPPPALCCGPCTIPAWPSCAFASCGPLGSSCYASLATGMCHGTVAVCP